MKVVYHILSLDTIYAGRTIYYGYKNAFEDLGHAFVPYTPNDNLEKLLDRLQPELFMTGLSRPLLKYLDLDLLRRHRERGMKVFVNVPFWRSPLSKLRMNEAPSLKDNPAFIRLIQEDRFGDVYFNVCSQGDARMEGFEATVGRPYHTVPLAADRTVLFPETSERFRADISYIGTYLPEKREFFQKNVFPLQKRYRVRLYGQDWTRWDRIRGLIQRGGQYFNIPFLRSLQRPKLQLDDERRIYTSSTISINVHESYQRTYGDCNERTFKIPLCGGFEVTDDVPSIRTFFKDGEEIVIARNEKEWFEKIDYYIRNSDQRLPIIEAGRKVVLEHHTYHQRVRQLIELLHDED
jgi:hypothetical protein